LNIPKTIFHILLLRPDVTGWAKLLPSTAEELTALTFRSGEEMEAAILVYQREQNLGTGHLRGCNISQNTVLAITIASHLSHGILLHGQQHVAIRTIHAIKRHSASPWRRQNVTRSAFSMEAMAILLIAIRRI